MTSRLMASAVGGLMLLGLPAISSAQRATGSPAAPPLPPSATLTRGSLAGVVRDDRGLPISGAMVSALGSTTVVAVTDRNGRFELASLAPGSYLVRAHLGGYSPSREQSIEVLAGVRRTSAIALRRADRPVPVLTAGIGGAAEPVSAAEEVEAEQDAVVDSAATETSEGSQSETAWRLRHARRGILKETLLPEDLLTDADLNDDLFGRVGAFGRAVGSPARYATAFFADTPFSGQVNLMTSGMFETPHELFSSSSLSRGIAYVRLGAPVGANADWTVRGALTQADISSWILAGSYATRTAARHKYDIGWSYSTQRYDGGNPLARRDVTDGSRNVGTVYGFDTFAVTPALTVSYGSRYERYDYLDDRGLVSPRVEVTMMPAARTRLGATFSRTGRAPGAEEFLPPGDTGIWLPPQRTFSSFEPGQPLHAEYTTHVAVAIERDIQSSTVAVRAFRQYINDQLATLFGADLPSQPNAKLGHYFVGNVGDAIATGCTAEVRTSFADRVHGSVAYSLTRAQLTPSDDLRYLVLLAPSALRPNGERIHDVSTTVETNVPETSTRVLVLYRVSTAFTRPSGPGVNGPGLDSRFDVQVRQSLPFLNFTSARWEMLLAVRDFFREPAADQSVYDELLVVRPPKRIVGGVTMHF
jgi:hypothetical protein